MNSSDSQSNLKSVFNKGLYYLVPAWASSLIILFLVSAASLLNILPAFLRLENADSSFSFSNFRQIVLEKLDSIPHAATIVNFIFWVIAGILVYLIGIALFGLVVTARNDIDKVQNYLYPSTSKRTSVTINIFMHWILFLSVVYILFLLLFLSIFVFLPVIRELFMLGFKYPGSIEAWLKTATSSLILSVAIMAIAFLIRMIRRTYDLL